MQMGDFGEAKEGPHPTSFMEMRWAFKNIQDQRLLIKTQNHINWKLIPEGQFIKSYGSDTWLFRFRLDGLFKLNPMEKHVGSNMKRLNVSDCQVRRRWALIRADWREIQQCQSWWPLRLPLKSQMQKQAKIFAKHIDYTPNLSKNVMGESDGDKEVDNSWSSLPLDHWHLHPELAIARSRQARLCKKSLASHNPREGDITDCLQRIQ